MGISRITKKDVIDRVMGITKMDVCKSLVVGALVAFLLGYPAGGGIMLFLAIFVFSLIFCTPPQEL